MLSSDIDTTRTGLFVVYRTRNTFNSASALPRGRYVRSRSM